jgi:hypothetical protein
MLTFLAGEERPGTDPYRYGGVNIATFGFTPAERVPVRGSRGRNLWEHLTFAWSERVFP